MKNYEEILKNAESVNVSNSGKGGSGILSISVTNNINGKRITMSDELYNRLRSPTKVQFAINKVSKILIISENLNTSEKSYKVSSTKNHIVYKTALVEFFTEAFDLDFSDKTSQTFRDIEIDNSKDSPIAFVQM